MKDILKELYYIEKAKNATLLSEQQNQQYIDERKAYEAFFNTLSTQQKALYLAYEDIHAIIRLEENEELYCQAFSSGFTFSQELNTKK